jgi:hypothetical protein
LRSPFVCIAFLASSFCIGRAHAQDKAACLDASAQGQGLRNHHELVAAAEKLRICARLSCPGVVQRDCAAWLVEVERSLPTVVLAAKDGAGHDLFDVRVTVDGKALTSKLDGAGVPLDPGPHAFRFELADGTNATTRVLVKEGDKNAVVSAVLAHESPAPAVVVSSPSTPPPTSPSSPAPPRDATPPPAQSWTARRWAGLAITSVGAAGLATGAVFGAMASSQWSTAQNECPTHAGCSAQAIADRDSSASRATVSSVAFIAGGVLAAAGVVLFLTAPTEPRAASIAVSPAGLTGSF